MNTFVWSSNITIAIFAVVFVLMTILNCDEGFETSLTYIGLLSFTITSVLLIEITFLQKNNKKRILEVVFHKVLYFFLGFTMFCIFFFGITYVFTN